MRKEFTRAKRFFKVMMPGFNQRLNLPQKLCNNLTQEKSEQAVLKSCIGTWEVKVCRNQEVGLITFEDGWGEFVHRHGLCIGNFVVFEHIGNLHFNVFVFDESACEKNYSLIDPKKEPQEAPMRNKIKKTSSGMAVPFESKNPFFIWTIMPSHHSGSSQVSIPAKFRRLNYFGNTTNVVLRDPRGRGTWAVKLCIDKSGHPRCRMTKGWNGFYMENNLKVGDVCAFELIKNKSNNGIVMDVHIFPALS